MKGVLLVFDGLDAFLENTDLSHSGYNTPEVIHSFLALILARLPSDSKIISTVENNLSAFTEIKCSLTRSYHLQPLKPPDAAMLFHRLSVKFLPTAVVAHAEFMSLLGCNPAKILEINQLQESMESECNTIDDVIRVYNARQRVIKTRQAKGLLNINRRKEMKLKKSLQYAVQHIKNPNARVLWTRLEACEEVDCNMLINAFKDEYKIVTMCKRSLKNKDLMKGFYIHGMNEHLSLHAAKFDGLYRWFSGICKMVVSLSHVWDQQSPVIIHGFVTRIEAEAMLDCCPVGTFLIRFSNNYDDSIAISYVEGKVVKKNSLGQQSCFVEDEPHGVIGHIKGFLAPAGKCEFIFGNEVGIPLKRFIDSFGKLVALYNDENPLNPFPKASISFDKPVLIPETSILSILSDDEEMC
ncbi:hypothetical protein RFI_01709 [Reticulomyxa filosa]|uniref:SH2 domain-containing protein n=1 Tax=Reticulomyxa filosa TaxID=46433 RepID=X6PCG3_RETFI|nr:hypothetical protein RFI_01709 [Reticulomyxa filosa]|eukprot:ETO35352.1 hypothetical protein RFI_01709 [Reticulomyxa filosa]